MHGKGGGRLRAVLEDNGQEGTERPEELSVNTQGKDGIHTAAAVCSRCQSWGLWVWAQKVTSDTREHNLSLGITVIIGGRGEGRKGRREGRKKGMRGREFLLLRISFHLYTASSLSSFRFPPMIPIGTQSYPLALLDGKLHQ